MRPTPVRSSTLLLLFALAGCGEDALPPATSSCAGSGCPPVQLLAARADNGGQLTAVAVDATHAYYADTWNLWRVAKQGGTPERLADRLGIVSGRGAVLALDDQFVYAAVDFYAYGELAMTSSRGAIVRVPKAGGEREILADDLWQPTGLWRDGDQLYFFTGMVDEDANSACGEVGDILSVPTSGGPLRTLARLQGRPESLAVIEGQLYWSHQGQLTHACGPVGHDVAPTVSRMPAGGGPVEVVARGTELDRPRLDAVDSAAFYDLGLTDGIDTVLVQRHPLHGNEAPQVLGRVDVRDLLIGRYLVRMGERLYLPLERYHTAEGTRDGTAIFDIDQSWMVSVDRAGRGAPRTLSARFTGGILGLTSDGSALYLVNGEELLRIVDDGTDGGSTVVR